MIIGNLTNDFSGGAVEINGQAAVGKKLGVKLVKKTNSILVSKISRKSLLEALDKSRKIKVPNLPKGAENLAQKILELAGRVL